jgi:hypothetical protein
VLHWLRTSHFHRTGIGSQANKEPIFEPSLVTEVDPSNWNTAIHTSHLKATKRSLFEGFMPDKLTEAAQ